MASAWGRVRASPSGACLDQKKGDDDDTWEQWRAQHFQPLPTTVPGFDHHYALHNDDDAPVRTLQDKWRLLPYFLSLRSLLRQHIDSFDHFCNYELEQIIVQSPSNNEIRSDHDSKFFLRYEQVWVGQASMEEESFATHAITPFDCRLRDCTYSAPIYVTVRYTRGRQIVVKRNVMIGRLPIMLGSNKCVLRGKTEEELAALKECPYDPGGECRLSAFCCACMMSFSHHSLYLLLLLRLLCHQGSRKGHSHSRAVE